MILMHVDRQINVDSQFKQALSRVRPEINLWMDTNQSNSLRGSYFSL
jgi:hypothetical protein